MLDWPQRFAMLAETARDPRLKAYYAQGIPSGTSPLHNVPMAALDVETTGLDPLRNGIVSIGIVPMTTTRIQLSASRYWVVRPRVELTPESVTIHAITHAQIEAASDMSAILGEMLLAMAGRIIVVYCRGIERSFLDTAFKAHGVDPTGREPNALPTAALPRPPRTDRRIGHCRTAASASCAQVFAAGAAARTVAVKRGQERFAGKAYACSPMILSCVFESKSLASCRS